MSHCAVHWDGELPPKVTGGACGCCLHMVPPVVLRISSSLHVVRMLWLLPAAAAGKRKREPQDYEEEDEDDDDEDEDAEDDDDDE